MRNNDGIFYDIEVLDDHNEILEFIGTFDDYKLAYYEATIRLRQVEDVHYVNLTTYHYEGCTQVVTGILPFIKE